MDEQTNETTEHQDEATPAPADPHAILSDLEALLERDLPPLTFQLPAAQTETVSADTATADAGEADVGGDAGAAEPAEGDGGEPAAPTGEKIEAEGGDKKPPKKGITERFSEMTAKIKAAQPKGDVMDEQTNETTEHQDEATPAPADPHAILSDLEALLERDLPPLTFQLVQDGFAKIRTAIGA